MLVILTGLPLLGIVFILISKATINSKIITRREVSSPSSKLIGLVASIITLMVSLIVWYKFDASNSEMQFVYTTYMETSSAYTSGTNLEAPLSISNETKPYGLQLGIDGISLYFVLLTTIIVPITILSDWNISDGVDNAQSNQTFYIIIILLLETILLLVFLVTDLLLFYISFEATLPPLFLLIGYFGSGNKIKASYYLLLYTLFGSLFLLLAILTIYYLLDTTSYNVILNNNLSFEIQTILWILMFISFAVKTPLFPFHIWLNLAHSEAPLGGSILLASVILKLALYGFLRIVIPMLPLATIYFTPFVYCISVITIIWASLTTLRQVDTKRIVAYSSIAHVAVSLIGAFSNTQVGIEGSILLGLAHGLVSPALFIIVGGVLYSRYHTRMIIYYRGLITYYPLISLYFFLFTLANSAVPLSANFIGEFMSLQGSFTINPVASILASSSIVLSAAYSVWLWSRISTGPFSQYLKVTPDLTRREFYILTPLLFLTVFIGIAPNFILQDLHCSVANILIV